MPDPIPLKQPQRRKARAGGIPYADTDIFTMPQNTIAFGPNESWAFIHPEKYANPSFSASVFNMGPGAISMRWDGQDTLYGDPSAILLPAGTGYANAITSRIAFASDASGCTISMSIEQYYG
jgi:hypothetical protein